MFFFEVIGGCNYRVEVCYKFSATSKEAQHLYLNEVTKLDVDCDGTMNMVQVMNYLNMKIASLSYIASKCLNVAPCEEGGTFVQVLIPICWKNN